MSAPDEHLLLCPPRERDKKGERVDLLKLRSIPQRSALPGEPETARFRSRAPGGFGHRAARGVFAVLFAGWVGLGARVSHAQDTPDEDREACIESHEKSQVLRFDGKLLEAREHLRICSRDACPAAVRTDCTEWLEKVQFAVPSVVFVAHSSHGDATDVQVTARDRVLAEKLPAPPVELNPGEYTFQFTQPHQAPVSLRVVIREGEKSRVIAAEFPSSGLGVPKGPEALSTRTETTSPPTGEAIRPIPALAYVMGGLSLASLGGAVYFGVSAQSDRSHAAETCSPSCAASVVDSVRHKALASDLFSGGALLSAGIATVLVLTRPTRTKEQPRAQVHDIRLYPSAQGLAVSLGGRF